MPLRHTLVSHACAAYDCSFPHGPRASKAPRVEMRLQVRIYARQLVRSSSVSVVMAADLKMPQVDEGNEEEELASVEREVVATLASVHAGFEL